MKFSVSFLLIILFRRTLDTQVNDLEMSRQICIHHMSDNDRRTGECREREGGKKHRLLSHWNEANALSDKTHELINISQEKFSISLKHNPYLIFIRFSRNVPINYSSLHFDKGQITSVKDQQTRDDSSSNCYNNYSTITSTIPSKHTHTRSIDLINDFYSFNVNNGRFSLRC